MASDVISILLSIDASELMRDLERIERGEMNLPAVSAVNVHCDGLFSEEIVLWLPEA